jgi:tetratricopeptide (TPR) repeat protein
MNIELNKQLYQVNSNEFNTIIHNEYNNLRMRDKLGFYERIASLLKDLSPLASRCLFFSQSHGGYLGCQVAQHYDKVYFLNNQEKNAENIRTNVAKFGVQNVAWDFSGDIGSDGVVIFSEDYSDIDEEIIEVHKPFILTTVCQKLIKNLQYAHVYELSGTNLVLCVPYRVRDDFLNLFKYYIKGNDDKLYYDNLIHLCIMVKNGGKQFEDMLNANMHLIDRWTILDTGSTDETVEIVKRVLVGKKKGELYEEPFINFRDSRNRLLDLAGDACKYTLMLDDTYVIKGDLRGFLEEVRSDQLADSFTLYIKSDDVEYGSNRILRTDKKLRYKFKIHEVIQDENNMNVVTPFARAHIFDGRFDYMEERTMKRKELDLKLLYEEVEDDPNNPRTYYYLAQTYNLLADFEKALHYFLKRADHPVQGFIQEKIDSVFEAARIANFQLQKPWPECEALYLRAYQLDNSRPDSLYFLGIHHYLESNRLTAFEYFKRAFEIGYPVHCQYSLKPTLSFHFLPKFLTQLCYEYNDFQLGERCARLFLEKNKPDADMYQVISSWYNIFVKLNQMNTSLSVTNNIGKPLLCFVADGGFEPWTGSDILTKGVGGSETYIIEMARYIQKHGHFQVIVFCNCLQQSTFEGVDYIPLDKYPPFSANAKIDTCIISRFSEYVPVAIHGKTDNIYLVLHDLTPSGVVIPIHDKLKKIFCLSEWHVGYFTERFPQFIDRTTHFYYGVTFGKSHAKNTFEKSITKEHDNLVINLAQPFPKVAKVENKFIYSSFPNRGLLQLLQMWPRIIEKYSNASLHIYSDVNGKWVNSVEPLMMQQIRELLSQLMLEERKMNITCYGWVGKEVLSESWATAEYWLYPCTFMETFCLTAVEAALSKTLAITNGLAALQNTVGDRGVCIEGDASSSEWQDKALDQLFSFMEDNSKREKVIQKNYEWARKLTWESQANKLLNEHILQ